MRWKVLGRQECVVFIVWLNSVFRHGWRMVGRADDHNEGDLERFFVFCVPHLVRIHYYVNVESSISTIIF